MGSRQYIGLDDNCFFSLHNGLPRRAPLGLTDIFGERIDHGNFFGRLPFAPKGSHTGCILYRLLAGLFFSPIPTQYDMRSRIPVGVKPNIILCGDLVSQNIIFLVVPACQHSPPIPCNILPGMSIRSILPLPIFWRHSTRHFTFDSSILQPFLYFAYFFICGVC